MIQLDLFNNQIPDERKESHILWNQMKSGDVYCERCETCIGTGTDIQTGAVCPDCNGKGWVKEVFQEEDEE
ncbi:TPA_asm: hypothetical protein vir519_00048 [Caudoviricetes sp. vir519]|nr:TPA_asm: hypothetical protein vir519_00048 [Caudoviricetes sp. vir519]